MIWLLDSLYEEEVSFFCSIFLSFKWLYYSENIMTELAPKDWVQRDILPNFGETILLFIIGTVNTFLVLVLNDYLECFETGNGAEIATLSSFFIKFNFSLFIISNFFLLFWSSESDADSFIASINRFLESKWHSKLDFKPKNSLFLGFVFLLCSFGMD